MKIFACVILLLMLIYKGNCSSEFVVKPVRKGSDVTIRCEVFWQDHEHHAITSGCWTMILEHQSLTSDALDPNSPHDQQVLLYAGGKKHHKNKRYSLVLGGGTDYSLKLKKFRRSDEGLYMCSFFQNGTNTVTSHTMLQLHSNLGK